MVLLYLFGGSIIAVDMFTNLFTTNASEAGELLANLWPAVLFVCILYLPLLVLGVRSLLHQGAAQRPVPAQIAPHGARHGVCRFAVHDICVGQGARFRN
ncbi:MAG: phosphoethanolamine transferase domain-containing protein [Alistipes indistinctus]